MISYHALGPHKRLSEIVFAGSHDASITSGAKNVQTQDLNIMEQAKSGVRIFDMRILARRVGSGATLVGYHGRKSKSGAGKQDFVYKGTGTAFPKTKTISKMSPIGGGFGERLVTMLQQARKFVTEVAGSEFLIFKFDKCSNHAVIAEECINILGPAIYKPEGELAKRTLDDLKGKVICVFSEDGLKEITDYGADDGILGFRSLNSKDSSPKPYDPNYPGLQYIGKGGTSPWNVFSDHTAKAKENFKRQAKILGKMQQMEDAAAGDVLGMMYWTSTGMKQSILKRNDSMWTPTGVRRMRELWEGALENAINVQVHNDRAKCLDFGGVRRIKAFIPNIIMIDFADPDKCQTIYDLNHAADTRMAAAIDEWYELRQPPRAS